MERRKRSESDPDALYDIERYVSGTYDPVREDFVDVDDEALTQMMVVSARLCVLHAAGRIVEDEPLRLHASSFSESRAVSKQVNPGVRKKMIEKVAFKTVRAFLGPRPELEWEEFDPLAERRSHPHGGYRQHEVRGFYRRMKKSGKTVPVRPFLRGDPARGVVKKMLNVQP